MGILIFFSTIALVLIAVGLFVINKNISNINNSLTDYLVINPPNYGLPTDTELLIPTELALQKIKNKSGEDPSNVLSGHADITQFRNYLNYIQTMVQAKGATLSGIEFFFAKNDGAMSKVAGNNGGRETLVIFPTIKINGKDIPIILTNDGYVQLHDTLHNHINGINIQQKSTEGTLLKSVTNNFILTAANKLNMSPPRESSTQ